ncbi:MAG: sigma-54 dependent transcriptional regulator [Desulfuromonadales bacterium]|nr:sigma-54 dependent transcriptional regulator [Desulfuromonadales bacterium]
MNAFKHLTLLFVEDQNLLRQSVGDLLTPLCKQLLFAVNGREALDIFLQEKPDLVLTDIIMPEMDGITLTEHLSRLSPQTPVIIFSAFSDTPNLLRAIELGVAGFVPKPCNDDKLIATLEKAATPVVQRHQLSGLRNELLQSVEQMLGRGPQLRAIAAQVVRIARSNYAVLIQGETGAGKSRLASIIHGLSPRADQPFVSVQLGAIPESLVAAELFGHEKGAFTGAERKREGLVGAAKGGTLFLDDIDAAPPAIQALLLQLVDEKSYHPLGSNRVAHADIRIIAASNKDLAAETAAGNFRQDLYYRLATFMIEMPPLRTLPEDIPLLAEKFLREACHEIGRAPLEISAAASALLRAHPWPGNIRELHNVIKYAAVMTDDLITPEILHNAISRTDPTAKGLSTGRTAAETPPIDLPLTMAEVEKWALKRALAAANGKKMVAARLLDMNYYTFKRHLKRHSIDDNLTD